MNIKIIRYIKIVLNPIGFEKEMDKLRVRIQKKDRQIEVLRGRVKTRINRHLKLNTKLKSLYQRKAEQGSAIRPKVSLKDALMKYAAGEIEAPYSFLEQFSPEDPIYNTALSQFARVAMKRKYYDEALRLWEATLAFHQDDIADIFLQMSLAYSSQGIIDKAIKLLTNVQECGLYNSPLLFQLARLHVKRDDWNKAVELVTNIITEDRSFLQDIKFANFAAMVFWHFGDIEQANTIIEQVIAENDVNDTLNRTIAIAKEIHRRLQAPEQFKSIEVSKDYYNDIYQTSLQFKKAIEDLEYKDVWEKVVGIIKQNKYIYILDVGCGMGQFAEYLIKQNLFIKYTGVDFSEVAINAARSRNISCPFLEADIFHTDILETSEYDLVLLLEVLEHIENDLMLLNKVPEGKTVMFSVPNFESFSHIRVFPNEEAVSERYSSYFVDLHIISVNLGNQSVIYLALGVRNEKKWFV